MADFRTTFAATVLGGTLLVITPALAADYYVAPDGDDSSPGTEGEPFRTVGRGQTAAAPGDTVFVRGGTYSFTTGTVGVAFTKAGQTGNPIRYFAYPGETPIFDLSGITNPSGRVTGFDVNTSYVHIKGMEIRGVPQYQAGEDSWGLRIRGNGNVVELMNVHHNEAPGIFLTSGANNLILNSDSHHNYDVLEDGGSGDGFGCHSTGSGNVISGCRGYENSDDGYDFINAPGACTVEKSWAFRNGYIPDSSTGAGNGAGFKAGGFGLDPGTFPSSVPRHVVRQCVAFLNRSQGFYANHHPGGIDFFNNTAFSNGSNFNMLADVGESSHTLRNNVALAPGGTISSLSGGTDDSNSVSAADFMSTMVEAALASRSADGSLPTNDFARLTTGSDLIDQGVDVGLPYAGTAPDLGAFEAGLVDAGGAGGAGGAGAAGAAGGSMRGGAAGSGSTGASGAPSSGGAGTAGAASGRAGANGGIAGSDETATGGAPSAGGGRSSAGSGGSSGGNSGGTSGGQPGASGTLGAAGTTPTQGTGGRSTIREPGDVAEPSGCGCRVVARPRSFASLVLLLPALALAAARRRRSLAA
jgi:hypothetical protein